MLQKHGLVLKIKEPGAFNDLNYFSAVDFKSKEEPRFEKKKRSPTNKKNVAKVFWKLNKGDIFCFSGSFEKLQLSQKIFNARVLKKQTETFPRR